MTNKKQNRVLSDHKQHGKKFIPPFIAQLGPLTETSWTNTTIPEIFWAALFNKYFGYSKGIPLALDFIKAVYNAVESDRKISFYGISSFLELTEIEKNKFVLNLQDNNILEDCCLALAGLIKFYPQCPLSFIVQLNKNFHSDEDINLKDIQNTLTPLFDRTSIEATLAQASIAYTGLATGHILLHESMRTHWDKFPEIMEYPTTDDSRAMAASIRTLINAVIYSSIENDISLSWPIYFWNQGIELDTCI